jgi:hypothetical protein
VDGIVLGSSLVACCGRLLPVLYLGISRLIDICWLHCIQRMNTIRDVCVMAALVSGESEFPLHCPGF